MGAIILQGPHHSAKKSTNTGFSPLIISPKVELASMFFFFFKHTEYQSTHHCEIEGAVKWTRSDFTSTRSATNELPVKKTYKASNNSTDHM
jgi:hypothetical protein